MGPYRCEHQPEGYIGDCQKCEDETARRTLAAFGEGGNRAERRAAERKKKFRKRGRNVFQGLNADA